MIVQEMQDGLIDETATFGGRIERYTYWLLFLEQAVQSVIRKLDSGEMSGDAVSSAGAGEAVTFGLEMPRVSRGYSSSPVTASQPTLTAANYVVLSVRGSG